MLRYSPELLAPSIAWFAQNSLTVRFHKFSPNRLLFLTHPNSTVLICIVFRFSEAKGYSVYCKNCTVANYFFRQPSYAETIRNIVSSSHGVMFHFTKFLQISWSSYIMEDKMPMYCGIVAAFYCSKNRASKIFRNVCVWVATIKF